MPICKHIYVAGKKRGQACDRFVRGKGSELCYQHKNGVKSELKEPEVEKPIEEKPVNNLAQSVIKKKKPVRIIYESSSSSSSSEEQVVIVKKPRTTKPEIKKVEPLPEPIKKSYKQLVCSSSSSDSFSTTTESHSFSSTTESSD